MKKSILMIIISILSLGVILISLSLGGANISLDKVFYALIDGIIHPNAELNSDQNIIIDVRLPRVLLAFLIGGAMSVGGAITQSLLKNPLASPFMLGVSSGASLGVVIVVITGVTLPLIGFFTLSLVGFIFGLLSVWLVIFIAYKLDQSLTSNSIILVGMVLSMFFSSIVSIIVVLSGENVRQIIMWQLGSLSSRGWREVITLLPFVIIGLTVCWFKLKELDILTFGDDYAGSVGVDTIKTKRILITISAILTGGCVAVSGVIGFVDLIVPHIARRIFSSCHRAVIPSSFIIGGGLLVLTDTLARMAALPSELPLGAITALFGAPFFISIYFSNKRH